MKNLKMFAITLLAFLVMVSGVHAAEENPCAGVAGKTKVYASIDGQTSQCYNDLAGVMTAAGENYKNVTIKLYDNLGNESSVFEVKTGKSVTLDLNGYNIPATVNLFKVDANGSLTVKSEKSAKISSANVTNLFRVDGGKLTIDGKVTLESTVSMSGLDANKKAMIAVKGNDTADKTEINVSKDVKVTTKGAGLIIYSNDSDDTTGYATGESAGVVVNVAGTWTTDLYTISVHGQVTEGSDSNPIINISEGKFTSKESIAFYASGYGEWNVKGGEITGADAFKYRTGKVVIEGEAKLTGKKKVASAPTGTSGGDATGSAFVFSKDTRTPIDASATTNVKLNGGTFKSESADGYAIYFEGLQRAKSEEAVIEINSGSYTSYGDKAAIGFGTTQGVTNYAKDFLANHESIVKGGEFANAVAGPLDSYPASAIAQTLTKGIELKTENGKVVVGNGNVNINDNTPDDQGNTGDDANTPGTTNPSDTNVPDVPKTNDNILVYASLGLVSALTVGFTTKRKENN